MVKYPSVIYYSDRNMSVTEGGANMGNLRKLYMGALLVVKKNSGTPRMDVGENTVDTDTASTRVHEEGTDSTPLCNYSIKFYLMIQ